MRKLEEDAAYSMQRSRIHLNVYCIVSYKADSIHSTQKDSKAEQFILSKVLQKTGNN